MGINLFTFFFFFFVSFFSINFIFACNIFKLKNNPFHISISPSDGSEQFFQSTRSMLEWLYQYVASKNVNLHTNINITAQFSLGSLLELLLGCQGVPDHVNINGLNQIDASINGKPHTKNLLYISANSWSEAHSPFCITLRMPWRAWTHPIKMTKSICWFCEWVATYKDSSLNINSFLRYCNLKNPEFWLV